MPETCRSFLFPQNPSTVARLATINESNTSGGRQPKANGVRRSSMRILVACEYTGIVTNALRSLGHSVCSCDLLPSELPGEHYTGDVLDILYLEAWDMIVGFPPCTYLAKVQLHMHRSEPGRLQKAWNALDFFVQLYKAAPLVALENPPGFITTHFRPADQYVQPWYFGNPHQKQIGLWLKNLPPLISTCYSTGRQPMHHHVNGRMSQAEKSKRKSRFFPEVAEAMARQWTL